MTRLIANLLARQDPSQPHSLLTRLLVSSIIIFAMLVYAGFFGVMTAVVVYLLMVELMSMPIEWIYAPVVIALAIGLWNSLKMLKDYWTHYGHG